MRPKISSVSIVHKIDESPDLSHLGEYSEAPSQKYITVDHRETGDHERGHYEYWISSQYRDWLSHRRSNGSFPRSIRNQILQSWKHVDRDTLREMARSTGGDLALAIATKEREYAMADYARHEAYNRSEWECIGIYATAEITTPSGTRQTIRSAGLWGIETDSEPSYFLEVAKEELDALRAELESFGFSKRQINAAYKLVELVPTTY